MERVLVFGLLFFMITSCATRKEIVYFQDADQLDLNSISQSFEPIIEKNDILYISVSSIDDQVVKPFQRTTEASSSGLSNSNPVLQGYLVNPEGNIRFPVLGDIAVTGLTRGQVEEDLKSKLREYVLDAVVDVRIMNFKITVLGEVRNPGVFTINDERVTLPQALGLAGDLTEDGKRENVVVIREEDGKQKVSRIDMTKTALFSSPFYFLKQNDVVYVEPSLKGVKKSGFIPDIPALLSVVTIILSATILLTR